ncbi:hypothetical protein GCM10025857_56580 [Alicyclobacillus contaminans]|uniref:Uncharacterized protein n=1 Tax=Tetragenococcus osmophilus TaxID=526944 RepID=A0AA38CYR7_9ENTE|nr:hypothetical protein [Tetragenococcus osmophilus]GMA54301.1 hypothetical protein GCM10025857_56580 [Alicyclobacillus contaminans]GMA71832.1 hypothetical protein GCM10025885_08810 [Tetragenococcus osmophilus]
MDKAQRSVAQKMGLKHGERAYLHRVPADSLKTLELPELDMTEFLNGEYDYMTCLQKVKRI